MQMMERINAKLDKGWKMTDVSCIHCNGTTLAQPTQDIETLYCPKENKEFPYNLEQSPSVEELRESEDEDEQLYQKARREETKQLQPKVQKMDNEYDSFFMDKKSQEAFGRTNDVSKKIGEKLLQGWTMLNQSCYECYAPLMKSKKGEKICFGCNRDFSKEIKTEAPPRKQKSEQPPKKEIKKPVQKKPVAPKEEQVKQQTPCENEPTKQESKVTIKSPKAPQAQKRANLNMFTRIEKKSLQFLQGEADRQISKGNIKQLEAILCLVYKIKNEFR